jgi:membrane protease YdiL (CAAX protease family)
MTGGNDLPQSDSEVEPSHNRQVDPDDAQVCAANAQVAPENAPESANPVSQSAGLPALKAFETANDNHPAYVADDRPPKAERTHSPAEEFISSEDRASSPVYDSELTRIEPDSSHQNGSSEIVGRVFTPQAPTTSFFADYLTRFPPAPQRIPNFGHLLIFILLAIAGYLCSGLVILGAMHFHLFGVTTLKQAANEIRYTLGSQAAWYFVTVGVCTLVFPIVWHRGFFDGLGWRAESAIRLRVRLIGAAVVCFVLAVVDGILIPGPPDTPIDQIFRMPGAAWLLFGFGVTLAPFFEETAFRGFLLPALCTAYDWASERITHAPPPPLDDSAHPQWSVPAMAVASILTSIPFALMHGEQTGYSLGPFVLLICVSLVLCWVRLATRSLASSVFVHSCYNLLLFSLMLAGTGGFKHLERM